MRKLGAIIITVLLIALLLLGVNELPEFGNPLNPDNNELSYGYIENSLDDTGAKNIIASIILDYRALDTFVEASLLFTAAIAIVVVLKSVES